MRQIAYGHFFAPVNKPPLISLLFTHTSLIMMALCFFSASCGRYCHNYQMSSILVFMVFLSGLGSVANEHIWYMQGDGNTNIDLEKDKNETRASSKHAKVSLY